MVSVTISHEMLSHCCTVRVNDGELYLKTVIFSRTVAQIRSVANILLNNTHEEQAQKNVLKNNKVSISLVDSATAHGRHEPDGSEINDFHGIM